MQVSYHVTIAVIKVHANVKHLRKTLFYFLICRLNDKSV